MRKYLICSLVIIITLVIIVCTIDMLGRCIEASIHIKTKIPLLCKKELNDYNKGVCYNENLYKFYLSNKQTNQIMKKVNQNQYWHQLPIKEKVLELITKHSIYNKNNIPDVKNGYWIYKNRTSNAENPYDAENVPSIGNMSAYSIGILDVDKGILYYFSEDM